MSIQSEITRINTNIANAYSAVQTMGGTLPATQNSANLPAAIATIPVGGITGYTILDYIEGTGTQYIDTGITPTNSYKIEMTASNHGNDDTPFFGAYNTWTTNSLLCYGVLDRVYFTGQGNDYISHNPTSSTPYTIKVSSSAFSVDNQSGTMTSLGAINTTLKLFWGGSRIGSFKLYSTKVYNGNTLVGDYIPVQRVSDSAVGLYDNISKTFFGNSGTGTFTAGNPITPGSTSHYLQLEWIDATGCQYIDTGVNASSVGRIQTKITQYDTKTGWSSIIYAEESNPYPGCGIRFEGTYMRITYGLDSTRVNYRAMSVPTTYEIDLDGQNDTVIINGNTISANFDKTLPNRTLYVFANHDGNGSVGQYGSTYRLYYLKIYDLSGNLIRDFVPVLDNTTYKVGLIDKLTGTFYQNSGVGEFIPGIKIAGYSLVDYIDGNKGAYLDTGVSGGTNMEYCIVLNTLGSKINNYEQYFAGDQTPASHKIFLDNSNNKVTAQQGSGVNWSGTSSNDLILFNLADEKHTLSFYSNGQLYLDNVLQGTGSNAGWGTLSYYVFNSHGESTLRSSMRLYLLIMKTDGDVVRFYVPVVRESDSVVGVYDLVNDTFTKNYATWPFTYNSKLITDDGTSSLPFIIVPNPSTYSGSIANQILRIKENIANAYDVCAQLGRTMPPDLISGNLESTILGIPVYRITWMNYDGSVLKTEYLEYGDTPSYSGPLPVKEPDQVRYVFTGWSPSITTVTQSQVYTAQYTTSSLPFTITYSGFNSGGSEYVKVNDTQSSSSSGTMSADIGDTVSFQIYDYPYGIFTMRIYFNGEVVSSTSGVGNGGRAAYVDYSINGLAADIEVVAGRNSNNDRTLYINYV